MIYRDELLFDRPDDQHAYEQHAFTCEPFHNLVQHNLIADDGVSFRFRRDPAEAKTDFFASEDRWCRPVMVRTGPDGALWVVDMYRYMIEHPQWLPKNGKDELRPWYRSGEDRGRIYRIVRSERSTRKVPQLADLSAHQLVAVLESPNGWQRDTAQRMLVRRKQRAASGPLQELARKSKRPLARLHALWTLDGLGAIQAKTLEAALADSHAGVRRNAVRIVSHVVVDANKLAGLVDDLDAKVRLELASTLGACEDPTASAALADLLIRSASDPYIKANAMSSLRPENVSTVLSAALQSTESSSKSITLKLIDQAIAMGMKKPIGRVIEFVCPPQGKQPDRKHFEALSRVLDSLARQKWTADKLSESARQRITKAIQHARTTAENETAKEDVRASAIHLLGRDATRLDHDFKLMERLLAPQSPAVVQQAVVTRLAQRSEPKVGGVLLAG